MRTLQQRIAALSRLIDQMQELRRLRDQLRRAALSARKPRLIRRRRSRSVWSRR